MAQICFISNSEHLRADNFRKILIYDYNTIGKIFNCSYTCKVAHTCKIKSFICKYQAIQYGRVARAVCRLASVCIHFEAEQKLLF